MIAYIAIFIEKRKTKGVDKMLMEFNYKKILFFLLCCLNFYSVIFEDIKFLGYIFYYIIPVIFCAFNYKILLTILKQIIQTPFIHFFITCILIGILSIIIPIAYGTFDFSYFTIRVMQITKELVKMIFLLVFFIKYISPNYDYKLFMKYYVISTCTYVMFTILTIAFPTLRELIINHLEVSANTIRLFHQENYFTRFGWCGFSGFTFTLKASLSVIFSLYFIVINPNKHLVENLIMLLVSFLGNLFYGRIGLIVSGIMILITLFCLYKNNKMLVKKIILIFTYSFFVLILFSFYNERLQMWFNWTFQNFINFFTTGSFSTTSTEALENMYVLPSLKTFFIGDGYYSTSSGYYMNIDIGLLRPIYFAGIFFQLLRYYTLYIPLKLIHISKIKYARYFSFCLLILFIIFELKGESIFPVINLILIISIIITLNKNKVKIND